MKKRLVAMEELDKVCEKKGIFLFYDPSIKDGILLYNPKYYLAFAGDYINEQSLATMLAMSEE